MLCLATINPLYIITSRHRAPIITRNTCSAICRFSAHMLVMIGHRIKLILGDLKDSQYIALRLIVVCFAFRVAQATILLYGYCACRHLSQSGIFGSGVSSRSYNHQYVLFKFGSMNGCDAGFLRFSINL